MANHDLILHSRRSLSSLRLSEEMQKRMVEAQVRTAKAKLRNHIKGSAGGYTYDECLPHITSLINVDCEFSLKYEIIPITKILSESTQKDTLKRIADALNILEKYGKNLLRPSANRPPVWRSVMFANGVFSDKVDWMVGGREILRHYGYVDEILDGVAYPDNTEPDPNKVAMVTSDIMLAREEIQFYIEGRHPHPSCFEEHLPATARVLQNLPHNAFDSICDTYIPESIKTSVSEPNLNSRAKLPPVIQQVPQTNRHDPFNGTVVEIPPSATTVVKPRIPDTPPADGMKDCDICGQQHVLFTCDMCDNKVLCKDCDEQWHKHPKRLRHQRTRADMNQHFAGPKEKEKEKQKSPEPKQLPSTSQFKPSEISEQGSGKSEIIRVIPGKGKAGGKDGVTRSQLPNLPIFDSNTLTNSSEEFTSGKTKVDLQREMAVHGIRMQSGPSDPNYLVKSPARSVSHTGGHLPHLSVFDRTLTNATSVQQSVDLKKEMESQGIKLQRRHTVEEHTKGNYSHQSGFKSVVDEQPRVSIQDILKIPNFEQKRIKLEALVINTTTEMKQVEENLQLVIVHEPNFLDSDVYKELIKKKGGLLRDLQIFESYRKMFEEEEKVRRLYQESQDEALFHKSICLPPGDLFIPPTTRSSMRSKSGEERLSSFAPSMLPATNYPSVYEAPLSLPAARPQQVYEVSPWQIATNVLGLNAEYKGACPKCGKITNYYNDACHHCKEEIPLNIKQEVLPQRSPLPIGPGKGSASIDKMPSASPQTPAGPSVGLPGMGAKPKVHNDTKPTHVPEKQQKSVEKVKPKPAPVSLKFGVHPKKWLCQHCTFENDAMTRVCLICDRTSDKPEFVEENITDDDKINSGEWDAVHSPRNVAVNFQQDAEQMALEKKKAREEFQRMMEEEERKKSERRVRMVPDSSLVDKTVGVDDVDAGIGVTDEPGNIVTDRGVSPKDLEDRNNINLQTRGVSDEEKFKLLKELDDIAAKKQEEETLKLSRDTVKLIRLAENQGFTFDELTVSLNKNNDNEKALLWLQETWQEQIREFMQMAVQATEESVLSNLSELEARRALVETNCDLETAVSMCIQQRKEKINELCELAECTREMAGESLHNTDGDMDEALEFMSMKHLQKVSERLWTTTSSTSTTSSHSSVHVQTSSMSSSSSSSSASRTYQCHKLDPATEATVMDRDISLERRARLVLVEGKMQGWGRAENVLKVLDLLPPEQEVNVNDVIDAVTSCGNIQDSLRYLLQECEICYTQGPMSKMLSLPLCQCKICVDCLKTYFEVQVKEKHVREMVCPVCGQPDIQDEVQADTHFTFISMLIHSLITPELNNLFLEKLRDWKLMQDPNFRWCSHCACGFIFNSEEGQKKMRCPDCNKNTCYECKKPWEGAHEGLSCAEFTLWKQMNDPEHQAAGLARHLAENGINCPECKFRYALAKGGCMHFKCTQCRHEFCSGCYKPFKRGENCQVLESCASAGLHCHHPRDCLFYLRDFEVDRLQTLLTDNSVDFDIDDSEERSDRSGCPVMEQKELPDGFKDEACGKDVPDNSAGLCQLHYKEYLVSLINKNNIDPVDIMDTEELQIQCRRYGKNPPNKRRKESVEQYRNRFVQFIQRQIHLPRRNDGIASS